MEERKLRAFEKVAGHLSPAVRLLHITDLDIQYTIHRAVPYVVHLLCISYLTT
jgi:hypothetical protein